MRQPFVITSAFTCSLAVHVVAGAAAAWLAAYTVQERSESLSTRTAPPAPTAPAPESLGRGFPSAADASSAGPSASPQPQEADKFVAKLLQNRYALSVRSGQLSGAGAPVLQSAIARSRFVVLGEHHGVAQTPELGAAICRAAGPDAFHTLAVEEDPTAAAELEGWAQRSDGLAQLASFQKKFPESINIYRTREEFEMLQQCARAGGNEFRLWGLNQEVAEINRAPPTVYENARRRERLMKTRFAANYARAAATGPPPKVLLKFGAFHGYRGLNPPHGSGIGNYVAEFAEGRGDESLHIYLIPVKSAPGSPNLADQPRWRYLQPIVSNLLPSGWTMFDLRPLRQDLNAPGGPIAPELATLVFGYDILVVVPEGTPSTRIR